MELGLTICFPPQGFASNHLRGCIHELHGCLATALFDIRMERQTIASLSHSKERHCDNMSDLLYALECFSWFT